MAAGGGGELVAYQEIAALETESRQLSVYDAPIGLRLLFEDPDSGEEHYLVRYPPRLGGQWHRHTAPHTIVVLEGRLDVNDRQIGPGGYCHFPAGKPMRHLPAGDGPCVFLNLFHGPFDVEPMSDPPV